MSYRMTEREQDLLALGIDTRIQEIKDTMFEMLQSDKNSTTTLQKMENLIIEAKELLEMKNTLNET